SVGVSWTGQCWERNPKDRSVYRSEATISTFSSTRIEIRTGDTAPFVMIPASGISGVISQNSTNTGSPATSAVFSEATPSPGKMRPVPQTTLAQQLLSLSDPEQQSIEAACSSAKYVDGPAAYNRCLQNQLDSLATAPRRPDLSGLNSYELQSIEAACSSAKYVDGPAAYNRCLVRQLQLLKSSPR